MIETAINLQHFLFESGFPSRRELLEYETIHNIKYKVCVYRNHSFELVENTIKAYLDFADCLSSFVYSDYDDSLSFINFDYAADAAIIWLDISRYSDIGVTVKFISERLDVLSAKFQKPILLAVCGGSVTINNSNVLTYQIDELASQFGEKLFDERLQCISGTKLSSKAMMFIAKEIGLKYLPSMLRTPLKAIVVDLDNTLYRGVLGEDGFEGIILSPGHIRLQNALKALKDQGFFLAIISKNDIKDVVELFEKRKDFPLCKDDFATIQASWDEKSALMKNVLSFLNIHYDGVLFLDDNIGELNMMDISFNGISCLKACDDADITANILEFYPRLRKFQLTTEDTLRTADSVANEQRRTLQNELSPQEYLKSLNVNIRFGVDELDTKTRVVELSNKTNQFIFNYRRYTNNQIEHIITADNSVVVTVSLKDKLSDSGIVGVCVALLKDEIVYIDEIFVSCRALGRGLDEIIVMGAISVACDALKHKRIKVLFRKGERNVPAEKFAKEKLIKYLSNDDIFDYNLPRDIVNIKIQGRTQ